MMARMWGDTLQVPRAEVDLEDPWAIPAACTPVALRRATDGTPPRLSTRLAVWYDETYLAVLFAASDDHLTASHRAHDAPVWEEDAFELFLAPEREGRYFEIDVNPLGTIFDAAVTSPLGIRASMHVDRSWACEGLLCAIRTMGSAAAPSILDVLVRVPFAALGRSTPRAGEEWTGNFFRIDRHPERGGEFSAWQPTMKTPPDFHVVAAFGRLAFTG